MGKNKGIVLGILAALALTTSGCGHKEGENIQAGSDAIAQSDYAGALQCFEQAILSGEDLELSYRGMGITYLGMADYDNATASFEKALDNAGIFAGDLERDINFYMATALYKNGQSEDAEKLLDAIIDSDKKNADAFYLKGSIRIMAEDYESGIYNLEKAMQYADDTHAMKLSVYEVLSENGYEDKGREYLTQMLEEEKGLSDYEQGVIYFYLEEYDDARNHLETAKQTAKKEKGTVIYMLGRTYEQLGDSNYASILYSEYLEENPEDVRIYNQLGLCELSMEDADAAIHAFENALALEDTSMTQTLKYNQIVAYERAGDFSKAKSLMDTYLSAYPDDEKAQREAVFLRTR
jgi:tetratricopeptide (TPR) repeat protein